MEVKGNQLLIAKTKEGATVPSKTDENAGYDLYACFDDDYMLFKVGETKLVPTGIAIALTDDYYMQIQERGSTGSKGIKYGAGVIDPSFRGEIFVPITNLTRKVLVISKLGIDDFLKDYEYNGVTLNKDDVLLYPYTKAIAQGIIHRVHKMYEQEISYEDLLTVPSSRGTGMLGSSGK